MLVAVALVFFLAVAVSLAELAGLIQVAGAVGSFAGREAALVHGTMNLAMGAMALPLYSHRWHQAALLLFAALLLAEVVRLVLLLRRPASEQRRWQLGGAGYHLFSLAAMLYALGQMPMMAAGHSGHHAGPGILAWVLAGVFVVDAVATVVIVGFKPASILQSVAGQTAAAARSSEVTALRLSAFPHVVMDLGMAAMLVVPAAIMA